jgi:hypothetical protein
MKLLLALAGNVHVVATVLAALAGSGVTAIVIGWWQQNGHKT